MKDDRISRLRFEATLPAAVAGAVAASCAGAFTLTSPTIVKGLSSKLPIAEKKKVVSELFNIANKNKFDLSKTTAFRAFKEITSVMKEPRTIATGLVFGAVVGAVAGLLVDACKGFGKKSA